MPEPIAPRLTIREILHPRAVAVFGASESRDKFGGRIMYFLAHHGFEGTLVPINPNRAEIRGRTAYARLADAPVTVDVAILAVTTDQLVPAISECAACGVGACVIITTGFAEAGAAGAALQDRIVDIARAQGMRIIGPNCMGLLNPAWKLALCSSVVLDVERLLTGRIGLVSQSGALMVSLFDRAYGEGIGFSSCVSLGNQSDVEICDFLEYLIEDPATDAICLYVEGFRDPARFIRAAAACRAAGKPLVVLKTGKTQAGVRAAQSHTASLAGSYEAFAAICRTHGVVLVEDPVALVRIADILARGPKLAGNGIGILSGSGGGAGIMVDRVSDSGFRLARLADDTKAALQQILLPPQADNPIDLGGRLPVPEDITIPALRILTNDPDVALVLLYLSSMPFFESRTRMLAEEAMRGGKPALALVLPGPAGERPRAVLRELGVPYFDSTEDLLVTLRGVLAHHDMADIPAQPTRPADLPTRIDPSHSLAQTVAAYGITFPVEAICTSLNQAVEAAEKIGFPVVLKGDFATIVHKSDLGLVKLDLRDPTDLRTAWREIADAVAAQNLTHAFRGCLVQEQIQAGLELIVSIRRDPQFGPFVLVGAGGVWVELLHDVTSEPAPISRETAIAMLRRLRVAKLLDGYRGGPALDIDAVADCILRLSWLAVDLGDSLEDIEINPLIAAPSGRGARAVDLRGTIHATPSLEDATT